MLNQKKLDTKVLTELKSLSDRIKVTDVTISLSSISWTSSGVWFGNYSGFSKTGTVIAITEKSTWSGMSFGIIMPYINASGEVGLMATAKPTSGTLSLRIVELI